jgi:peptidoglycan-N-acetylglucosamine deacetylase
MAFFELMKRALLIVLWSALAHGGVKVAVTVDDLPSAAALPKGETWTGVTSAMLAALKRHGVKEAYGFLNAGKIRPANEGQEVLRAWRAAGHPLGNHAFHHEDLHKVSLEDFKTAIEKNEPTLAALAGATDWKYFRYPFLHEGQTDEQRNGVRDYLKARGYQIAQVTVDFEDWSWNQPYTRCKDKGDGAAIAWLEKTFLQNASDVLDRSQALSKYLFKREIRHVLLLHIGGFDAHMLDRLLALYVQKGVEFISLKEALQEDIYAFDPGVTGPWGAEFPYQVLKARKLTLADAGMLPYKNYPDKELEGVCR